MPELPEVETIRRDLSAHLAGQRIERLTIRREDILRGADRSEFISSVSGQQVLEIQRRGKNLIVRLSGSIAVLVNLGMTGQLFVCGRDDELADHTHIVADLSSGRRLIYRDVRRFGHVELARVEEMGKSFTLRNVGVDAMGEEFTADYLALMLEGRQALLKAALLDQSRLAGLGNIYVCEALFRAGIDPETRCCEVAEVQIERLHAVIREVLAESIEAEGTTISDYVTGNRVPGSFQERLDVYGREGEVCRRTECDHVIERVVQSNRSTFYCPGCQRGAEPNRSDQA